ncbi:hypothetical protein F2Q68_00019310 [Brassica cretica]|uniref:Uncharacterized protein n=1 Tax=Brassica cretica TaxID=69181 RepID=A0A8S9FXP9_BRACR|nr:hypothetical protein F2Q68_00019310 [Brassica cretica]
MKDDGSSSTQEVEGGVELNIPRNEMLELPMKSVPGALVGLGKGAFPPVMFVSSSICLLLVMELGRKDRLDRSYALMCFGQESDALECFEYAVLPDSATDCDSSDAEASQKDTDSRLFVISQEGNQQSYEFLSPIVLIDIALSVLVLIGNHILQIRAPRSEVQTNKWECFCSVFWDPLHADCAVPQELETDEIMQQLKYINMLRPRSDAKTRKIGPKGRSGSQK